MINRDLLNKAVEASGKKKVFLAKKLGITPQGLNKKVRGMCEFKGGEIQLLSKELNLSSEQRDLIFFADEV